MMCLIELQDIRKTYYVGEVAVPALRGVSFTIDGGEFVAIMGSSGSGKSSLMNIVGCLDVSDSGLYRLDGHEVNEASEDELAKLRGAYIGFVFQLFNLIPRINAQRNVALPLVYAGVSRKERMERARHALELVGLGARLDHSPAQLSGGQQQRVAIARALVADTEIIIADEPTGSLDSVSGEEIMRVFSDLNRSGKTIIVVTHEEAVAKCARRIVRLRDGVVHEDRWG